MKPNWFLIANATHARLLQQEVGSPMVVLKSFDDPLGRAKVSELGSARAGQERTDRGFGGAAYEPRLDAKEKEHLRFARELAEHLEQHAQKGDFRSLVVLSSSPFLGELKVALGPVTQRLLTGTHDVDLTSVGLTELERRIAHEVAK